ncbi:MAG: 50S ribosomal protein L3 [Candidatus Peribacteria bacterium]|nr:MAG: 50S ribosomal protein L3 [Candidatus Peribacteria bacterium]
MTRLWIDDKMVPVTLLALEPQEVIRYKTDEKDGYNAVVVGTNKKTKNDKTSYGSVIEFAHDQAFADAFAQGATITSDILSDVASVTIKGVSKGKGFQGGMKRFNLSGGEQTHGSKFHRWIGSMGNRKPRRVQKGHPHAGHMGTDAITLHNVAVLDMVTHDNTSFLIVKGSIPGAYNSTLQVVIK